MRTFKFFTAGAVTATGVVFVAVTVWLHLIERKAFR